MKLKNLTLCLLGLSLSACSMQAIKSNQTGVSLDQKAVQGLNAMYSNPSFDFNGQFKLDFVVAELPKQQQQTLAPQLEKQLEAYLTAQKIKLSKQQKQDLYQAIAAEKLDSYDYRSNGIPKKVQGFLSNILSNIQFSYDGSVHYREQIGALNLVAKYETPNLLVQSKVPMVLDFKNSKFYVNYFGVMPFMVNDKNNNDFTYFDFSKYKGYIDQVDLKNMVAYLKENTAVPYVLAQPQQLQSLSLTAQDKAQGVVEKIRLTSTIEEAILQQRLFDAVNETFMTQSIVNIDKIVAEQAKAEARGEKTAKAEVYRSSSNSDMERDELEAYTASIKLYRLVNAHFGHDDAIEEADDAYPEAAAIATVESVEADDAVADADDEQVEAAVEVVCAADKDAEACAEVTAAAGLTGAECTALSENKGRIKLGDVTYCEEVYDLNVLPASLSPAQQQSSNPLSFIFAKDAIELTEKFRGYGSTQLTDVVKFKQLWDQNSAEIQKYLAKYPDNTYQTEIGLDQKGRVIKADTDLNFKLNTMGSVALHSKMNILNYGQATKISQRQLKDAKSFAETTQGSMLEGIANKLGMALDQPAEGAAVEHATKVQSIESQLNDLAAQIYDTTGSYSQAYEAVYAVKLSLDYPQIFEYYTPRELNEIARVYAYSFADQSVYNPKGQSLAELEKLMDKHQLQSRRQYDTAMGDAVYEIVIDAMGQRQQRQEWLKLVKQYKQPKAIFVQAYMQGFLADNDVSASEKVQLKATADILAQAYADSRRNKLSEKSIAGLPKNAEEYIDYDLYSSIYAKLLKQFK